MDKLLLDFTNKNGAEFYFRTVFPHKTGDFRTKKELIFTVALLYRP